MIQPKLLVYVMIVLFKWYIYYRTANNNNMQHDVEYPELCPSQIYWNTCLTKNKCMLIAYVPIFIVSENWIKNPVLFIYVLKNILML